MKIENPRGKKRRVKAIELGQAEPNATHHECSGVAQWR